MRRFHHSQFAPPLLVELKRGRRVAVCIPARNEEATVGAIVGSIHKELMVEVPVVDHLVVADDGSWDATAAVAEKNGADVVAVGRRGGENGSGKGWAMRRAVEATSAEVIMFCDADLLSFGPHYVAGLVGPLLESDDLALVKPEYSRTYRGLPGEGGRVTELMARPLIAALFPRLAAVTQPLAGETAVTRSVLDRIELETGYGVEAALLVDVAEVVGPAAIAQCGLGTREHRNRPLAELASEASEVMRALMARAGVLPPGSPGPADRG